MGAKNFSSYDDSAVLKNAGLEKAGPSTVDADVASPSPQMSEAQAFCNAVADGDLGMIDVLLKNNVPVLVTPDDAGMLGLHWACDRGEREIGLVLLDTVGKHEELLLHVVRNSVQLGLEETLRQRRWRPVQEEEQEEETLGAGGAGGVQLVSVQEEETLRQKGCEVVEFEIGAKGVKKLRYSVVVV